MESCESFFTCQDQHRLFYKVIKSPLDKAVLIFVHGLNEHCGRYHYPVEYFSKKKFTIYLFDHRGHGKSDGVKSFVSDFEDYLRDLHDFTRWVSRREKNKKIFMIGHSMGGQILLNYIAKYKAPIDGFLTSSANIQLAIKIPPLKRKLALWLSQYFPTMALANEINPKWISRDPEIVRQYKQDPLVSKATTLGLIAAIMKNQDTLLEMAPQIKLPAFIMHGGGDQICSPEGSRQFFKALGSKNKTLKIYDHFYHEIFNEVGKELVFADINNWISGQL